MPCCEALPRGFPESNRAILGNPLKHEKSLGNKGFLLFSSLSRNLPKHPENRPLGSKYYRDSSADQSPPRRRGSFPADAHEKGPRLPSKALFDGSGRIGPVPVVRPSEAIPRRSPRKRRVAQVDPCGYRCPPVNSRPGIRMPALSNQCAAATAFRKATREPTYNCLG